MICDCNICQRQHAEKKCIKCICSYFDWTFDRAPNEDASDYEYFVNVQNPFYGRCMTTIEEVNIAFDLIAAV